jgi:hypothetical protein
MEVFMFSVKIQTYFLNNFVLFNFASFDGATIVIYATSGKSEGLFHRT